MSEAYSPDAFDPILHNTVEIVSAHVRSNPVPRADLPGLIASIHAALGNLRKAATLAEHQVEKPTPDQIRKSITSDALISFLDGKPYKSLKRHLTANGHTPASYRAAYGLDASYPMVAAGYSAQRSALAKEIGLGRTARPGFATAA